MSKGDKGMGSDGTQPLGDMRAVVTGGGGAIGGAAAVLLARDGAHVLLAGRTRSKLERAAERVTEAIGSGTGSVDLMEVDALDEEAVIEMAARAAGPEGRIDMAVAVVGGGATPLPVLAQTVASLEHTLTANITSTFLVLKHVGTRMVAGGGGSIVAVSSMQATESAPMFGPYCAAKAGLEMLCRVAADELGAAGVRVNMVRPGLTRNGNDGHLSEDPEALERYMVEQPLARPGEAIDIGQAIRYLAGPESSWVTGESITVDGGTSLRRFPDLTEVWQHRGVDTSIPGRSSH
ncbi:MAG: SDR family oxidoreductase [Actinomycetota bacterium]|nr:SDR family oxidoreductase [Actinomycetota bacterium]